MHNDVRSIVQDRDGRFLFATHGGLSCFDGQAFKNYTSADGLVNDRIYAVIEGADGCFWLATEGGASRYDGSSFQNFTTANGLVNDHVYKLLLDQQGHVWLGTEGGLSRYDGQSFHNYTSADGLIDDDINALGLDHDGRVWIGTEGGLSCFDGQGFKNYTSADGLPSNYVMGISTDEQGQVWIATLEGASCFDGQSFTSYTSEDGLASNTVLRVFQDSMGYLWFATWGGVNRFDGEVFQTLIRQDGLASSSVLALLEDREGGLWFGTSSGVTCCHLPAPTSPPIYIRALVVDRRYEDLSNLSIPATAGLTAFEFHGVNFKTRPGAMVYRYRLEGREQAWQTTNARRVEYQDLAPGRYTFQVTAVDRDLNYSMPARVELEVQLDARDEVIDELEERVRERTRELRDKNGALEGALVQLRETQNQLVVQEKMAALGNLVAGVAHELNTPLGAVKGSGDVLGRGLERIRRSVEQSAELGDIKGNSRFEKVLGLLDNSVRTTDAAIERITQIVDSLKNFARLDQAEYQKADVHEGIDSTLTLLEHNIKENIAVQKDYGELPQIYCYPGELNQVFMNVLLNSSQAIDGEGAIKIKTYSDQANVYVEISDTGRGIPPERLQRIFDPDFSRKDSRVGMGLGLATSYNIVRKHNGYLRLESEPGKGTMVTVILPVESAQKST